VISTGSHPNVRFAMNGINIAGDFWRLSLWQQTQRDVIRSPDVVIGGLSSFP